MSIKVIKPTQVKGVRLAKMLFGQLYEIVSNNNAGDFPTGTVVFRISESAYRITPKGEVIRLCQINRLSESWYTFEVLPKDTEITIKVE